MSSPKAWSVAHLQDGQPVVQLYLSPVEAKTAADLLIRSGTQASVTEHDLPVPRIVIREDDDQGIRGIESDSPLLVGAQVAVIRTGFNPEDYDESDIFELLVDGQHDDFVGHVEPVTTPGWDIADAFDAIEAKLADFVTRHAPRR